MTNNWREYDLANVKWIVKERYENLAHHQHFSFGTTWYTI